MSADTRLARREEQVPEKAASKPTVLPAVDIYENAEEILLLADMPGVAKDQVEVRLDRDKLIIKAQKTLANEGTLIGCEVEPTDYARTFLVPQTIDGAKIAAELDRGVLKVHLPKTAVAKPRQITVSAG